MFIGFQDKLATNEDAKKTFEKINGEDATWPIVKMETIEGGHETFMVGTEMTYFYKAMELITKYNPIDGETATTAEKDDKVDLFEKKLFLY
jgi:hypothetical protein